LLFVAAESTVIPKFEEMKEADPVLEIIVIVPT
jgi:hypothetical protein